MEKVNFVDLKAQYSPYMSEIMDTIKDVISNTAFVGGKYLEEFEKSFAKFHDVSHCVGVGSGTDALWLTLLAFGVGPGDEVIVPANTFIATAFAVSHTGAKVVFVDADPIMYNMDLNKLFDAITGKTRAIIPVHLYGNPCNVDAIKGIVNGRRIKIIEDCAQACGAMWRGNLVGTIGDVGCFSFYPAKNLGGLGQGGAVITNNEEISDKVRELGNVGRTKGSWFDYDYVGFNSRLDSINAAFLNLGLKHIDQWNANRNHTAKLYDMRLSKIKHIKAPVYSDNTTHIYHLYEAKCRNKQERDTLKKYLSNHSIFTGLHYPVPCHLQKPYENHGTFPIAEELADTLISLPMHPNITRDEVNYICDKIEIFIKNGE